MQQSETWLPIPGWENHYSASDFGRIRSEDRVVELPCGQTRSYVGRILRQGVDSEGRHSVVLKIAGRGGTHRVHRLVLETFVGACPPGMEACHWDDNASNNRLENLRWDTSLANKQDMERNGSGNQNANKTHCVRGHEFTPENTYARGDGGRDCRACWKLRPSSFKPQGTHNKDKTHCVNGHEFTPENTYSYDMGTYTARSCRTCALARAKARADRHRQVS
jgi:hypothetical protein